MYYPVIQLTQLSLEFSGEHMYITEHMYNIREVSNVFSPFPV